MEIKRHNKLHLILLIIPVVLINAFIIVTASLSNETSRAFSNFFANIVKVIFNSSGTDTTEIVNVTGVDLKYDSTYSYNDIAGYNNNEVVMGKSKRLVTEVSPSDATNIAVKYEVSDSSIASIRQEGSYVYVTGLAEGSATITVTSASNENAKSTYTVNIVNKKAPVNYEVSDINVYQGSLFYLPVNITDKYSEYYDLDLLDIVNSNPSIVDESSEYDDLYYASSIGEDTFNINDKSFKVTVNSNSGVVYPTLSSIEGNNALVSGSSHQYNVLFSNEPTSNEVLWSISNEEYASISKGGYLTVKEVNKEVEIVVTAKSMLNPSIAISKTITLLPRTITDFTLSSSSYGDITNKRIEAETGQQINIYINNSLIKNKGITVSSSDTNIVKAYEQGNSLLVECLIEGDARIIVTSNENPEVSNYVDIHVVTRGVINRDNFAQFAIYVRKSLGHFLLFLLDGVFMLLLLSNLNNIVEYKHKKCWHYLLAVFAFAVFMAFLSEFIQFFIPYRDFSFVDIGVDLLGYVIGAGIVLLVQFLIKKHREKSSKQIEQK